MNPEALEKLREMPLPQPVSYAPQTIGWYILGALLLAALVWFAVRWLRSWRANRYRREALAELSELESKGQLSALPALVKRTALCFAPREEVGPLSGDRWLAFLDRTGGGTPFTVGPGRLLPRLAYASDSLDDHEEQEFMETVRRWIRRHDARI